MTVKLEMSASLVQALFFSDATFHKVEFEVIEGPMKPLKKIMNDIESF